MFHAGCSANIVAVTTYNYHRLYKSGDLRVLYLFIMEPRSLKIWEIVNVSSTVSVGGQILWLVANLRWHPGRRR